MDRLNEIKKIFEEDNAPIHRISSEDMKYLFIEYEKMEKALNEIDNHIRATPEPIPYIVETLKNTLPYYKVENYK